MVAAPPPPRPAYRLDWRGWRPLVFLALCVPAAIGIALLWNEWTGLLVMFVCMLGGLFIEVPALIIPAVLLWLGWSFGLLVWQIASNSPLVRLLMCANLFAAYLLLWTSLGIEVSEAVGLFTPGSGHLDLSEVWVYLLVFGTVFFVQAVMLAVPLRRLTPLSDSQA